MNLSFRDTIAVTSRIHAPLSHEIICNFASFEQVYTLLTFFSKIETRMIKCFPGKVEKEWKKEKDIILQWKRLHSYVIVESNESIAIVLFHF